MAEGTDSSYLEPWHRLDGKVVLVTGASSGIGREFCLDLAKAGCKIVAAARRTDLLKSLCEEINKSSSSSTDSTLINKAVAVELDLQSNGDVIDASVQKAWDAFGRIDALINNAGYRGGVNSSIDISEDEWNTVVKTNLTGSWLVAKSVCRRIRDSKGKLSVVNITSIGGIERGTLPGGVAYGASKSGLNSVTKMMALELGVYNIRVNAIAPGLFKSAITESLMQKEWLKTVAERTIPLKTYGTVNPALTSLVRYLIDDSSDYVTGNIFIADAGQTLPDISKDEGEWGNVVMVNSICPGIFKSKYHRAPDEEKMARYFGTKDCISKHIWDNRLSINITCSVLDP